MASLLFQGRAKVCITTLGSEGSILMMRAGSSFRSEICNKTSPIINPFQVSLLVCSPLKLKLQSTTIKFKTMNGNLIEEEFDVLRCSSWPMKNSEIIDTTGAGDAFIGGFLACVNHGLSREVRTIVKF
jgi:sugar/nucleoside kinase (ribokinase family)